MVNIPILGRFHRYVRGIEVTILSNSAVKYKPNTTSLPFKQPLVMKGPLVVSRQPGPVTDIYGSPEPQTAFHNIH